MLTILTIVYIINSPIYQSTKLFYPHQQVAIFILKLFVIMQDNIFSG